MARGKTLSSLLTSLRVELRASVVPANNVQVREMQIARLQRTQETLWEDYSWPHLRVERYFAPEIGQRYFDTNGILKLDNSIAGDMRIDRVNSIWLRDGSIWRPIKPGIDQEQYNAYDSDSGQTAWPPRRWAVREDDQIELWPVPGEAGNKTTRVNMLKVVGIRDLRDLITEDDRADIDDRLIVLFAAAELLQGEAAKDKFAIATRRMNKLRGNMSKIKRFRMLGGEPHERLLRGPPTVYYRTTP